MEYVLELNLAEYSHSEYVLELNLAEYSHSEYVLELNLAEYSPLFIKINDQLP